MPDLQTIGRRFESTLYTAAGFPVKGVVLPNRDDAGVTFDFSEPRITIRLRHDTPVKLGEILADPAGRKYLLAVHDSNSVYDKVLYNTVLAYPINKTVKWERISGGAIDTLTGLKKSGSKQTMGTIDVLVEMMLREDMDPAIRVREETLRLITASPIQLNDIVDNMVVKRVNQARGVWVAEIE